MTEIVKDDPFALEFDEALRDSLKIMRESREYTPAMMEVIRKRLANLGLDLVPTKAISTLKEETEHALRLVEQQSGRTQVS